MVVIRGDFHSYFYDIRQVKVVLSDIKVGVGRVFSEVVKIPNTVYFLFTTFLPCLSPQGDPRCLTKKQVENTEVDKIIIKNYDMY